MGKMFNTAKFMQLISATIFLSCLCCFVANGMSSGDKRLIKSWAKSGNFESIKSKIKAAKTDAIKQSIVAEVKGALGAKNPALVAKVEALVIPTDPKDAFLAALPGLTRATVKDWVTLDGVVFKFEKGPNEEITDAGGKNCKTELDNKLTDIAIKEIEQAITAAAGKADPLNKIKAILTYNLDDPANKEALLVSAANLLKFPTAGAGSYDIILAPAQLKALNKFAADKVVAIKTGKKATKKGPFDIFLAKLNEQKAPDVTTMDAIKTYVKASGANDLVPASKYNQFKDRIDDFKAALKNAAFERIKAEVLAGADKNAVAQDDGDLKAGKENLLKFAVHGGDYIVPNAEIKGQVAAVVTDWVAKRKIAANEKRVEAKRLADAAKTLIVDANADHGAVPADKQAACNTEMDALLASIGVLNVALNSIPHNLDLGAEVDAGRFADMEAALAAAKALKLKPVKDAQQALAQKLAAPAGGAPVGAFNAKTDTLTVPQVTALEAIEITKKSKQKFISKDGFFKGLAAGLTFEAAFEDANVCKTGATVDAKAVPAQMAARVKLAESGVGSANLSNEQKDYIKLRIAASINVMP